MIKTLAIEILVIMKYIFTNILKKEELTAAGPTPLMENEQ
jgi:hypothetical protein